MVEAGAEGTGSGKDSVELGKHRRKFKFCLLIKTHEFLVTVLHAGIRLLRDDHAVHFRIISGEGKGEKDQEPSRIGVGRDEAAEVMHGFQGSVDFSRVCRVEKRRDDACASVRRVDVVDETVHHRVETVADEEHPVEGPFDFRVIDTALRKFFFYTGAACVFAGFIAGAVTRLLYFLFDIGVAGAVECIVAEKTHEISIGSFRIPAVPDDLGSAREELFSRPFMHRISDGIDSVCLQRMIVEKNVRSVLANEIKRQIFPQQALFFSWKAAKNFLTKSVMGVCVWHFFNLPGLYARHLYRRL